MKIFILANNSGGLYDFRGDLINKLAENNEVIASTPDEENLKSEIEALGCKLLETSVERRGMNPIKDLSLLKKYIKMLKKIKPDLVLTYTIKPNVYGCIACRMLHIPYAANITGLGTAFQNPGMLRTLVTMMYKVSLKKAKVVFFENSSNKQILVDGKMVKESQTCVLNGAGVNLERFECKPYPEEKEQIRFLFMGRVMKEKGVDELLYAMDKLNKDGVNCTLDMLGFYEDDYEPIINQYKEVGWLNYHGYQDDVKPFIENCHCFVLPSYHEGMANTNLECAAIGRPIITSNIPGCKEAVIDEKTGFLAEVQNAESLYEKMKDFCQLDWQTRADMGQKARQHMIDVFDKQKVVSKTIEELFRGIKC